MSKKVFYLIILLAGCFLLLSIYKYVSKSADATPLSCHKEVVVFDKVYDKKSLHDVIKMIMNDNYTVEIQAQKAEYSHSDLFEYVSLEDVQLTVINTMKQYIHMSKEELKKSLHVEVIVYENDKDDPGKKTPKSKLYRGYLVFSFILEQTLIYKIQIDFIDYKARDIPKRIECAIQTLMQYKNGE